MSFIKREKPEYQMDAHNYPSSSNKTDGSHGDYSQHSGQASQASITAFLAKLWALVNDSSCDDLIAWDPSGASFHVYDQGRFSREILPRYFKHNNFASFIRQLNMYGFRKMSTIEHGSLKNERDDIEFAHPHFVRDQETLLELIKRRAPDNQQKVTPHAGTHHVASAIVSTKECDSTSNRCMEFGRLLDDVRSLQSKQTTLNDKLSYLETENEALWSEIGSLRHKHAKQQQIVTKLMHFLAHFLTHGSIQSHDQSNQQRPSHGVVSTCRQSTDTSVQSPTTHLQLREREISPNTLKRKQAVLMLSEEPNKRINIQCRQPPLSSSDDFGRQQSITINELTDSDICSLIPTPNSIAPVIDLVPSPPSPPVQGTDNNYQQHINDCPILNTTNELINLNVPSSKSYAQHTKSFSTVGNADNVPNAYVPDFFLCTDNPNENNRTIGQILGTNVTGTTTAHEDSLKQLPMTELLKQDKLDFQNKYSPNTAYPIVEQQTSPNLNSTLYNSSQPDNRIDAPLEQLSFSLDDITGDVDHIQSTLDNIRDLMFESLPDGTSIDDLFGAENGLLSPLLQAASHDQTTTGLNMSQPPDSCVESQCIPGVDNQLLEQLLTETAKAEEQRITSNNVIQGNDQLTDQLPIIVDTKRPRRK